MGDGQLTAGSWLREPAFSGQNGVVRRPLRRKKNYHFFPQRDEEVRAAT
jgi:hypothetical protein